MGLEAICFPVDVCKTKPIAHNRATLLNLFTKYRMPQRVAEIRILLRCIRSELPPLRGHEGRHRMDPAFVVVLLAAVGALASKEDCPSGQYTTSGECCQQCQPGDGVVTPCGDTQTECAPCLDSETFSENFSHTEQCKPCTECRGLLIMKTPCTDSNDATCACKYGYYMSELSQQCEPCTMCPEGQGVLAGCEIDHDTICEKCEEDTYSDQESSWDPCIPCTSCDDSETLHHCTSVSNTVCQGKISHSH
ncbi:unnamed protein product [Tetraodon nigroviridis]|uniref:(spotted green pufferfish) hypothetical protein n=1 Tax=Tetraodon nigroviridis TaxID=99883 RepID=Q4RG40_TETNG|nr:unnamed protein product [Tetraodon nigroviridis]